MAGKRSQEDLERQLGLTPLDERKKEDPRPATAGHLGKVRKELGEMVQEARREVRTITVAIFGEIVGLRDDIRQLTEEVQKLNGRRP